MRLIGILIAIVLGVGTFLVSTQFMKQKEKPKERIVEVPVVEVQEVPTVDIIVARNNVPIGTPLTEAELDRQPWPSHLLIEDFIVSDGKDVDILGMVTRAEFRAREPVIRSKLSNPDDPSFLAASLDEGQRAVTIAVDELSGVGGFIFPGDRVDVIVTQEMVQDPLNSPTPATDMGGPNTAPPPVRLTEVLATNVKVIATGQKATTAGNEGINVPSSVTLAVTRGQAQKIKLAEQYAKLSLSLRALKDKDSTATVRPTGMEDLSRTKPPAYFPTLYDSDIEEEVSSTKKKNDKAGPSGSLTVIRGSAKERVGVTRP